MKKYSDLTQRGQARRLRKIVFKALERYDLKPVRVRLITNETNGIFRIDTADKNKYVMRLTDPKSCHSEEEIMAEMFWLRAIAQETDLGVAKPIPTIDGQLVITLADEAVLEKRTCVLFSWVSGKDLAEQICPENFYKLGRYAAQLHEHGRKFGAFQELRVRRLDKVFPYSDPDFSFEPIVLFDDHHQDLISPKMRSLLEKLTEYLQGEFDQLFRSSEGLGLIHNDMHQWNVKVYRGQIYVFDFEDMMWGYPVQEIANTFYYLARYKEARELKDAYRRGYSTIGLWPAVEQIENFVASRYLMLANYLLASDDLEDKEYAPKYISQMEAYLNEFIRFNLKFKNN